MCRRWCLATGVVVGPHMRREVFIFKWLWNALRGLPIVVEGGDQTRDVTFIDDVVAAWTLAVQAPVKEVVGQKFYVGYGEERSVAELAGMCLEAAGAAVSIEYVGYRPGEEGQREAFSNQRARRVLGYNPKTAADAAIALTADWARGQLQASP